MADDKSIRGRWDGSRMNHLSEDYEVRYWSEKFGVSKQELAAAVKRVGPMVKDVEVELKRASRANG